MPWELYVDGASRGQGVTPGLDGIGAVGVIIYHNNQLIGKYARGLGRVSNNTAEMEALLCGLLLCWPHPDIQDPIIYTDSQVVAKMVNGDWLCTDEKLRPILYSIQEIREVYKCRVIQVPRVQVAEADKLAKQFLKQLQARLALDNEQRKNLRKKKRIPRVK